MQEIRIEDAMRLSANDAHFRRRLFIGIAIGAFSAVLSWTLPISPFVAIGGGLGFAAALILMLGFKVHP